MGRCCLFDGREQTGEWIVLQGASCCCACADVRGALCEQHLSRLRREMSDGFLARDTPTVAASSRMGCSSGEWDVMGGVYGHHPVVRACLTGTLCGFRLVLDGEFW